MQYESDAKVVHGLGIATLVLSILGVLTSLALIFGVGVVKNVVVDTFATESNPLESFIESDVDLSQVSDGADEFLQWLGEADIKDFEAVADSVTVKEINGFGNVILTGDASKIETALKGIESKYNLDIDAKQMAKDITSLGDNGILAMGETFADMDKDDLNDLRNALSMYDLKYVDDLKSFKQSVDSSETQQAVVNGIMAVVVALIVWTLVAYIISLIAAVLAMRNCCKPAQLTGAFVWSIIAAVVGFFSGHLITMVLLIIMCVYIGKVRKCRSAEIPGASAGAATMPPVQPTGAAPFPPQE